MIDVISDLAQLRARVRDWRREGLTVGFVPTMGNLHAGHYSLVALARKHADRVVSSVFVNPTQFGPSEDFTRYPRTPDADTSGLQAAGCDVLWLPEVEAMYPFGVGLAANVHVPGISSVLEGECRPGHFDGVCTVVTRLFNQVQPDVAAFGKKDFQQLAVIRQMVADLHFPLDILAGDIVRETDGLAMSSRNQYLAPQDRAVAPTIHKILQAMRDAARAGIPRMQIETDAASALRGAGFVPDYAVLRRPDFGLPLDGEGGALVALIAAKLGRTRLIDNIEFELPG